MLGFIGQLNQKLSDHRSQIIGLVLSVLGTTLALDIFLHKSPAWLTLDQYGAISALFGGPLVLAMRAGSKKAEKAAKRVERLLTAELPTPNPDEKQETKPPQ